MTIKKLRTYERSPQLAKKQQQYGIDAITSDTDQQKILNTFMMIIFRHR